MLKRISLAVCVLALLTTSVQAGAKSGLTKGTPDLKSAGPLAFGPDGILFIGDSASAAVFAIGTGDTSGAPAKSSPNVEGIEGQIAGMLGVTVRDVQVNDLAVNPASGNVYLSVSRGRGPTAQPALFRVTGEGKVSAVSLKDVPFAKATLPNAPGADAKDRRNASKRAQSITDLGYADGRVFVAGLSNEEFESTLRSIPFPFADSSRGTGVRIFHGAHGRFETASPVRTFTHFRIGDKPHLLAAYTCTPLVKFPVADLKPGTKLQGTTIAELGNRNRPLDMFVYKKGERNYILMANSSRGVMKITTEDIDKIDGITNRISGGGTAGLTYDTISELKGVEQLDRLNDENAVALIRNDEGVASLQTIPLP